ncbi:MAG: hydroxyacylglutathione hydrolase [Alphaproteobacteria bacterium]
MAALEIHQFVCCEDNFGILIHDPAFNLTAAIDTPDADSIRDALLHKGWALTHIFTTHHHHDHTAGHEELKRETNCIVVGATKDRGRIPGVDETVEDGSRFGFGGHNVHVIATPGHTLGAVCYWIPDAGVVFVGDTLFSLGCGRLFEGDAETMWQSVQKIMALPPETRIYCGHEYTSKNAAFALDVEPGNAALQARAEEVKTLRSSGQVTLPVPLAAEMAQNPVLRPGSAEIQAQLGMTGQPLATIFAELRKRRDRF